MNILLLSPLPPPAGGIATWTKLYLQSDEIKKHKSTLINTAVTGERVKNINKKDIKNEITRAKNILFKLRKLLTSQEFDIVHINTSCSKFGLIRDFIYARYVKHKKVPVIIQFHCDTKYMIKDRISEYLFNKLCRVADELFCLNQSSKQHIKKLSSCESMIIPNFFNEKQMKNLNRLKHAEQIKDILFVGHVVRSKGCIEILKLAEKLPKLKFKLIGYISDEIRKLPIPRNVEFVGEIPKESVISQMLLADVLLFPTYTEGFPNVILEAMACGLPIIATPVGAIPDMIEDSGGVLVEVGDINGMIKAINTLQDKNFRYKISKWNQEKVLKSYSTEIVMKKVILEYSNFVQKNEEGIRKDLAI